MNDVYYEDLDRGITMIDAQLFRQGQVSTYLIVEDGRAAFVETGTAHSVPALLWVLERKGVPREHVDFVIPTHVHLDHAGGAGALLRQLPNARLVIHPRGARHMIDPAKLNAGAAAVYGEGEMNRLFGQVVPVPAERVIEAADGDEVDLNGRRLRFLDTPGHARHHFCVVDETGDGIFTGDTFGLSYRWFDTGRGPFVLPTTTPVQFDPEALHASVGRLVAQGLNYMYLTHYSRVGDLHRLQRDLHELIDRYVEMARAHADAGPSRHQRLCDDMMQMLLVRLRDHGCTLPEARIRELLGPDVDLNVQGLEVWLDSGA
ncbi:Beta-lactamase related protein [Thioalkalivibrio nitratireducens DSM 14787]|uniref:Beta-lactamase related protein n=1 Tax=Thioalkalivibrio nitratireducens (strain DSM 14787 / UNIQEM 213 / ALEN2) TaxID=1255043 RepID=L0DZG2_THIND|nr:MBL fold metallo-hydrolase [Thioalkalivibrio nitratireducens]AGA34979.1 Beta-lactamase related protein [Thioalkalivibrio nitratireducens DSM 14787]